MTILRRTLCGRVEAKISTEKGYRKPATGSFPARKGEKIAAAVYEYRAVYDGEWGEIQFDFVQGTAEILKLAELDTVKRNVYAKRAISHILSLPIDDLPKKLALPLWNPLQRVPVYSRIQMQGRMEKSL